MTAQALALIVQTWINACDQSPSPYATYYAVMDNRSPGEKALEAAKHEIECEKKRADMLKAVEKATQ